MWDPAVCQDWQLDTILLLTEWERNILPQAFSALTSLRSVNTEKAVGNILTD